MSPNLHPIFFAISVIFCLILSGCTRTEVRKPVRTIEQWNEYRAESPIERIVCSGSGVLRLVSYLGCADKVVAIEQIETDTTGSVPYRIANPDLKDRPIFSNGNGRDNIEALLSLSEPPQVIFRLDTPGMGISPEELQLRTGIPVVLLEYGDLGAEREKLFRSLRLLGTVLDRETRAEEVIAFFEREIAELDRRTAKIPPEERKRVYLGGISYRGAHGMNSTTPSYPPFEWLHTENVLRKNVSNEILRSHHSMVPREQILTWNPDFLFIDLATLNLGRNSALAELDSVKLYEALDAVKGHRVHTLIPNVSSNTNFCAQLANAWFIGSVLYPKEFEDIDPSEKTKEIFTFLLGVPVLEEMNRKLDPPPFNNI